MNSFEFGKRAADYLVDTHPFSPQLTEVGNITHFQHEYAVLEDKAGRHFARRRCSPAPVLIRVYHVGQQGATP